MKLGLGVMLGGWLAAIQICAGATTVLYSTAFEPAEGYQSDLTLAGQKGWVSEGTGGNGLVQGFLDDTQQGFVGFSLPDRATTNIVVWQPVNYVPNATTGMVVRFLVEMAIIDSATTNRDDFRWSVYNIAGVRLFTLDFDNDSTLISYNLDDGRGFISTGVNLTNNIGYDLEIFMDFGSNLWTATLSGINLVSQKPITTANAALTFGDVDAVWSIRRPGLPGDNYMLFDYYRVQAETAGTPAEGARLEAVDRLPNGQFALRVRGQPNVAYVIEATQNFGAWSAIRTNSSPDGVIEAVDTQAAGLSQRFYRTRKL